MNENEVNTKNDIKSLFDSISYGKVKNKFKVLQSIQNLM